jgi:hypothetical protein
MAEPGIIEDRGYSRKSEYKRALRFAVDSANLYLFHKQFMKLIVICKFVPLNYTFKLTTPSTLIFFIYTFPFFFN